MIKPAQEELKRLADAARESVLEKRRAIEKLYEDQQRMKAKAADCWFDAGIDISSLVFYSPVKMTDMNFSCSNTVLEFHGTMWGPGLGKAKSYGGGYMMKDPDWLIGKTVNFELIFVAFPVAGVQMTFWYEGSVIGAFDAVGGGAGAGGGWGDGTFKKVG
jgi:hypothetical protein